MSGLELRPGPDEYAEHYHRYVQLVPDGHIVGTLEMQLQESLDFLHGPAAARADFAYSPGKWTIKQVVGHVADAELIFIVRALRIARADRTPQPAFDENAYVDNANFTERQYHGLVDDFAAIRHTSVRFFRGLPPEAWDLRGIASEHEISVRALAWIIAGHDIHHRRILQERYLPPGQA